MFADVVDLLMAWHSAQSDVPVVNDVPDPRPERFLQIRRIGGPALVPVREQPLLDYKGWSREPSDAMDILQAARAELWALNGTNDLGVMVYRIAETVGPRQANDRTAGQAQAWFSVALTIRADDVVPYH